MVLESECLDMDHYDLVDVTYVSQIILNCNYVITDKNICETINNLFFEENILDKIWVCEWFVGPKFCDNHF